jgi:hypothetical protein
MGVYSSASLTSILPSLSPEKRPMKALPACSIPSLMVSCYLILPSLIQAPISARNSS